MATWLDAASRYLIDTAIIGAVFSLACVLAMVVCRQPAQRCLLARGSLFGLLLTPLLPALWVQPSLVVPEFLFPSTLRPLSVVFDWLESLRYSLTGLLALGAGLGVARWSVGVLACRHLIAQSEPVGIDIESEFHLLAGNRGIRPDLRVHHRPLAPSVLGWFHPVILLPSSFLKSSDERALRLALLHELSHARRRDPAYQALGQLVGGLWFFLPSVWWIRDQMRLDQEFLADYDTARDSSLRLDYAASLVDLASPDARTSSRGRVDPALNRSRGSSPLVARVSMLLGSSYVIRPTTSHLGRAAAIGFLGASLILSTQLGILRRSSDPFGADEGGPPRIRLQMPRLTVASDGPSGHSATSLPLEFQLPRRFVLEAQVLGTSDHLAEIHILGLRLNPSPAISLAESKILRYHPIRIVRNGRWTRLWLDGRMVMWVRNEEIPPDCLFLESEMPQTIQLRDLTVSW